MVMADNVSTSVYVDPLLGLGLQFKAALTDVLENQRIDASLFGLFHKALHMSSRGNGYIQIVELSITIYLYNCG